MSDLVQELLNRLSVGDAPKPNLLDQAQNEYPALKNYPTQYKESPGAQEFMMEHWSPGDEDNGLGYSRPKEFAPDQYGVEVYSDKATPKDVAADIVSHRMVNDDPVVKRVYGDFSGNLTDNQKSHLQEQYKYAQANEGEKRPYADWEKTTGIPAAFRGKLFGQWPDDFNQQFYTPEQSQKFKALEYYLKAKR